MRCPKCGYISFDHQEICIKCIKNILEATNEVNGTGYNALPPPFLQFRPKKPIIPQSSLSPSTEPIEPESSIREGIDTDFVLDDREIAMDDELMMDLDNYTDEGILQEEYTLDLEEAPGEIKNNLPPLHFGNLDISDLAPPLEQLNKASSEELKLETLETVAAFSAPAPQKAAAKSTGLEDLQIDGLNLDPTAKYSGGIDKSYTSSVKTGTALDKFQVDLEKLFEEKIK